MLNDQIVADYLEITIPQLETLKRLSKRKSARKHPFNESPYYDFEVFRAAFKEWSEILCREYYDKALGYSQANGGKYLDWKRAIQNWSRNDHRCKTSNKLQSNNDWTA